MALIKAKIRFGYTPTVDKFMLLWGLTQGKVKADGFTFYYILEDLAKLNKRAFRSDLEAGIISTYTYFQVADHYTLLPCLASIGFNYGPLLVSRESLYPKELENQSVALPGLNTAAYLATKLFLPEFNAVEMPMNDIGNAVTQGKAKAGVLVGEDQGSYEKMGLKKVADLGEWFYEMTQLPFPYQVCVIRKNLGRDVMRKFTKIMELSAEHALKKREYALDYVLSHLKPMDRESAVSYADKYVNEYSLAMGKKTKEALEILQSNAYDAGLLKEIRPIEFVKM